MLLQSVEKFNLHNLSDLDSTVCNKPSMFLHSHGNLSHTYLDFLSGATISENHGHSGLVGTLKYVIHNNEQQTLGSF